MAGATGSRRESCGAGGPVSVRHRLAAEGFEFARQGLRGQFDQCAAFLARCQAWIGTDASVREAGTEVEGFTDRAGRGNRRRIVGRLDRIGEGVLRDRNFRGVACAPWPVGNWSRASSPTPSRSHQLQSFSAKPARRRAKLASAYSSENAASIDETLPPWPFRNRIFSKPCTTSERVQSPIAAMNVDGRSEMVPGKPR